MGYKRADVEATALYAKKFVRYEEGAKNTAWGFPNFNQWHGRQKPFIRWINWS